MPLPVDFRRELTSSFAGDICDDLVSRILYSTDASLYQIEPLGVVFPRNLDDLSSVVELAARYHIPITARGSGSSLGGQAIGEGIILDTSRYLNRIIEIDPESQTVTAEPGILLSKLNRELGKFKLIFGPDPASADRATLGGSIGNNATGAHSIVYGMSSDHLISTEAILADGSLVTFRQVSLAEAEEKANSTSSKLESGIYRTCLSIRQNHAEDIRKSYPLTWRRASGYNLNYLIPYSYNQPPMWSSVDHRTYPPILDGTINIAPLLAGSEGTLAVLRKITIRLVQKPMKTMLGVLTYSSVVEACEAVPDLLEKKPSAVELIPGDLIRLARSIPAYATQLTFVDGNPEAMLVVEFSGEDDATLRTKIEALSPSVYIAVTATQQNQVWNVRKVGLGLFNSLPGDLKALSFVEDTAVPVEKLGMFVREVERILKEYGTRANIYAHASAGCLHIRPLLNIKDVGGKTVMREIAEKVMALTISLGGATSAEHGDGLVRSQFLKQSYGDTVYGLFGDLKRAFDPQNIFNPGNMMGEPNLEQNLRYGNGYHPVAWEPYLDFSVQGSLTGAIEMCNGAGVCRKDVGLMCPSFQATQDEMNSPRGRSNLLRALISGKFPNMEEGEKDVYKAFDLCLACKGCKSDCPSGVDVARLKYEFLYQYYKKHPRKLRDYMFGYIDDLAAMGTPFSFIINPMLAIPLVRQVTENVIGLSAKKQFPVFTTPAKKREVTRRPAPHTYDVLFLADSFSRNFHPETDKAAIYLLEQAGYNVRILPILGAGRASISKGFLERARAHAKRLLKAIQELDPEGKLPVVGVEPSEIFVLRDEYMDFFPKDTFTRNLAKRAWMVDEFLLRPTTKKASGVEQIISTHSQPGNGKMILLHGQCIQKVQPPAEDGLPTGARATIAFLKSFGYQVEMVDSGCCGMAGSFGYEAEHYEMSKQLGEMNLFPAIRQAGEDALVAASGTSCRSQIKSGTGKVALHPAVILWQALSAQSN